MFRAERCYGVLHSKHCIFISDFLMSVDYRHLHSVTLHFLPFHMADDYFFPTHHFYLCGYISCYRFVRFLMQPKIFVRQQWHAILKWHGMSVMTSERGSNLPNHMCICHNEHTYLQILCAINLIRNPTYMGNFTIIILSSIIKILYISRLIQSLSFDVTLFLRNGFNIILWG